MNCWKKYFITFFAVLFFPVSHLWAQTSTIKTELIPFSEGGTNLTKEPSQHSRLGGSFGLGDVGDVIGLHRIGVGVALDTLWAPGNGRLTTDITMKLDWDFTKDDLNGYNQHIALKELYPHVPLGKIKISTKEFHFCRQLGFSADVGLDINIQGNWHNNVSSVTVADLGVNINDTANEKIGPHTGAGQDPGDYSDKYVHSDTVNITDLAGLVSDGAEVVVDFVEKGSSVLKGAAGSLAKSALQDTLQSALKISLGVQVTQTTYDRRMEFDLRVSAKDMDGKPVLITLDDVSKHIVIKDEKEEVIVYADLPANCPPIKELTLEATNPTYYYSEKGNFEVGLRTPLFSATSGVLTAGLMDPRYHTLKATYEPQMKIKGDTLVYVPFHGTVETGNPRSGLGGVDVGIRGRDGTFSTQVGVHPSGMFWDDLYVPSPSGSKDIPPYDIFVIKPGGSPVTLAPSLITKNADGSMIVYCPTDAAESVKISGIVSDLSNKPIEGVAVSAWGKGQQMVVTNAQGHYEFPQAVKSDTITLFAQKNGYMFETKNVSIGPADKNVTANIKATTAQLAGSIKLTLAAGPGETLPGFVHITRQGGQPFISFVQSDKTVNIPVVDKLQEAITIAEDGYSFNPDSASATFSGAGMETKSFNIAVMPTSAHSVSLAADKTSLEAGGVNFNDQRAQEELTLTSEVKDIRGNPVPGMNVRFDITPKEGNIGGFAFSSYDRAGAGAGVGYAATDSQGKAVIKLKAGSGIGSVAIKAKAFEAGKPSENSSLLSSEAIVNIIKSTRVAAPKKPQATATVYTNRSAIGGRSVPSVEVGGEFVFHFSATVGNPQNEPLVPAGTITAYKILFSKNNGAWTEESFPGVPPATLTKDYNEKGNYKIGLQVKEQCGPDIEVWSDLVQAPFNVIAFTPPEVTLNVPNATSVANIPVDYSFDVTGSDYLKRILLEFGDNVLDLDIDSGILSGKTHWPGSYFHTYTQTGTYTMKLTGTDVNNRSTQVTKQIVVQPVSALNDTTAPTGTLTIGSGAATTAVKETGLTISSSDSNSGSGVYQVRFSNDGNNWDSWRFASLDERPQPSAVRTIAWMLSDGAGTKTVYAQVKDAANNISAPITATVQLTATAINAAGSLPPPPVLNSAYHNAPMPHGSITIAQRDGNNLSLNLSASNDWAIFINQMAFSFDGQNWAGWIPFETSKQISLEGHSGATKIYVTFSDQAGGQSPIYSADIPAQTAQSQQSAQPAQSALPGQPAQTPAQQQGQAGQPPSGQSAQPAQGNPAANQPVSNNNAFVKAIERVKIREGEALRHEALRQQNQESDKAQREAERQKREEERLARAKERESAAAAALPTVAVSLPSASAALPSVSAALPAAAGPAVASQAAQKKIDVSVENIDVGRQAGLGDKVPVKVFLKNNSPVRVEGCAVRLENEDGLVDKQLIALQANERKTVEFIWLPKREGRQKLTAVIELSDDGNLRNNKMAQSIEVRKKEETGAAVQNAVISRPTEVSQETLPDASVENVDVPRRVEKDSRVNIIVTVRNNGTAAAQGCVVFVESEDGLAEKKDISLAANERGRETFTWTPKAEGRQKIHCRIECKGDSNERNNESSAMVLVASAADGIEKMRAAREAERELERSQHQEESRKEAGKKEEPAAVSPTISPAAVSAEADAGKQKEAELRQQEEAQQQAAEAQRQAAEAQRQKEEAQKKRELEKRLDKRGISGILSDESQKER